jgi:hypothetical protein
VVVVGEEGAGEEKDEDEDEGASTLGRREARKPWLPPSRALA